MSDTDLTDLCRRIAAEHAEGLAGVQTHAPHRADPLAVVGRLDAYGEVLQNLAPDVAEDVKEGSPR
jgi:hypothetical protein